MDLIALNQYCLIPILSTMRSMTFYIQKTIQSFRYPDPEVSHILDFMILKRYTSAGVVYLKLNLFALIQFLNQFHSELFPC